MISGKNKKKISETLETMKLLDEYKISWLGWEYKTFVRRTGFNDGIFEETSGQKRTQVLRLYSRPFPHAVPGEIDYMNYNDETGNFTLIWTVPPYYASEGAIISTGKTWHYPRGMKVFLYPKTNFTYHNDGKFIHIANPRRQYPQSIRLEILSY